MKEPPKVCPRCGAGRRYPDSHCRVYVSFTCGRGFDHVKGEWIELAPCGLDVLSIEEKYLLDFAD